MPETPRFNLPTVDKHSRWPAHLQIVEAIQARIENGTLAEGASLPSKRAIAEMVGVSHMTVTAALDTLAAQGLIVTSRGTAARVAERGTVVYEYDQRHRFHYEQAEHAAHRWEDRGTPVDVFDAGVDWNAYSLHRFEQSIEGASPVVAERFEIPVGKPCLRREFVEEARGTMARQIRVSWFDLDIVRNTPVADESKQPWTPGLTYRELIVLGFTTPPTLQRIFTARTVGEDERADLDLPSGAAVMHTSYLYILDGHCIETSMTVASGAATRPVVQTDM